MLRPEFPFSSYGRLCWSVLLYNFISFCIHCVAYIYTIALHCIAQPHPIPHIVASMHRDRINTVHYDLHVDTLARIKICYLSPLLVSTRYFLLTVIAFDTSCFLLLDHSNHPLVRSPVQLANALVSRISFGSSQLCISVLFSNLLSLSSVYFTC
ncbi:hypothetical protein EV424DRAFT_1024263 [Suillus variegatus]|nr:hypothetical protein EV424DRAFT_1024263 [Suillus variegatus]